MFSHHDARYNLIAIAEELILIQNHYSQDRCADCLTKHWLTVSALAREAVSLDNADQVLDLAREAQELAQKHLSIILSHIDKPVDINKMIQEVRELRKKIIQKVLGVTEIEHQH